MWQSCMSGACCSSPLRLAAQACGHQSGPQDGVLVALRSHENHLHATQVKTYHHVCTLSSPHPVSHTRCVWTPHPMLSLLLLLLHQAVNNIPCSRLEIQQVSLRMNCDAQPGSLPQFATHTWCGPTSAHTAVDPPSEAGSSGIEASQSMNARDSASCTASGERHAAEVEIAAGVLPTSPPGSCCCSC
jgi:hypothetical protein